MKSLFASMTKLTLSLVAVFSLSSCGEDLTTGGGDRPADPSKEKMTVFSTVSDGTRTTIDSNGIFYWQSKKVNNDDVNDQIWIDKDGTGASFSLQSSSSELYDNNRMGKFYFRGVLGADTYKLSYTGFGSTSGDEVTIAANQQQLGWDNAEHIGTSGDCATATATKQSDGNYSFTLNHKANYLIFQPYAPSSTALNPYRLVDIEIVDTEGNALSGTFPLKYDGLEANAGTNTSTSVRVSCSESNGEALTLPQSASRSIYAVILPRGGAEGGRALQVRYKVNTVSDGNFIVVQNISGNFEVNGARLIRHDLSVPAFPTVPTFRHDGNGLFGGIKFKPGFLYRPNGDVAPTTGLQIITDPFALLHYNQGAHGVAISEWHKRMFFTWNNLAVIFGHAYAGYGPNWMADITYPVTISGKNYRLPTYTQYSRLSQTPNSGRAVVNYYPASYAAVVVDLSADATYASLGWNRYGSQNDNLSDPQIAGYLFFPDEAFILDARIRVASLNGRWNTTASFITADELRNYVYHGCMFLPAVGFSDGSNWQYRGIVGNYWSSSINPPTPDTYATRFGVDGGGLFSEASRRTDYFPVVLVEQ